MLSRLWHGSLNVLVVLYGPAFPTEPEWDRHMVNVVRLRELTGDDPGRSRFLIFSDGGGPTAAQRRKILEQRNPRDMRGALVTASRLAAGIGSIMSLSFPGYRIFTPHEFARALAHLEIRPGDIPGLLRHIRETNADVGLECIAELPASLTPVP